MIGYIAKNFERIRYKHLVNTTSQHNVGEKITHCWSRVFGKIPNIL